MRGVDGQFRVPHGDFRKGSGSHVGEHSARVDAGVGRDGQVERIGERPEGIESRVVVITAVQREDFPDSLESHGVCFPDVIERGRAVDIDFRIGDYPVGVGFRKGNAALPVALVHEEARHGMVFPIHFKKRTLPLIGRLVMSMGVDDERGKRPFLPGGVSRCSGEEKNGDDQRNDTIHVVSFRRVGDIRADTLSLIYRSSK